MTLARYRRVALECSRHGYQPFVQHQGSHQPALNRLRGRAPTLNVTDLSVRSRADYQRTDRRSRMLVIELVRLQREPGGATPPPTTQFGNEVNRLGDVETGTAVMQILASKDRQQGLSSQIGA